MSSTKSWITSFPIQSERVALGHSTCTNLVATDGSGVMQIFRNGVLIASPTILDGSFNSYPFAVDEGDTVDIIYISMYAGWNGNFEVVDAEGSVMFNSNAPSNTTSPYGGTAAGVFGLRACEETSSCGSIKINLYDAQGDGWDVGSLYVYDGPLVVDIIGGNWYKR